MKKIPYVKKEMDKATFIELFLGRTLRALDSSITNIVLKDTADLKKLLTIERTDGQTVIDITKLSNLELTQEALNYIGE
ncbi:MAG: hypothetical protein IJ731_06110 [Eubacterium sp.]|nr:hypothetical protein [Eubacterium sp.]